jgi:hypothetical protein
MKTNDNTVPSLDALRSLLASARVLVDELVRDPLLQRAVTAFLALPESDREPIVAVLERDSTWRRIIAETSGWTGIKVAPNPHASLYVHLLDEVTGEPVAPTPSPRDVEVVRLGIGRFVPLLPLFFQEGVHEQWARSARELVRAAPPELRSLGVQFANEILAIIAEADAES